MGYIKYESLFFLIIFIFIILKKLFNNRIKIYNLIKKNILYIAIILAVIIVLFLPHFHTRIYPEGVHTKFENGLYESQNNSQMQARTYGGLLLIYYPLKYIPNKIVAHSIARSLEFCFLVLSFILIFLFSVDHFKIKKRIHKIALLMLTIAFTSVPNIFELFYRPSMQPGVIIFFFSIILFMFMLKLIENKIKNNVHLLICILLIYNLSYYRIENLAFYIPLLILGLENIIIGYKKTKKINNVNSKQSFKIILSFIILLLLLINPISELQDRGINFESGNLRHKNINLEKNAPFGAFFLIFMAISFLFLKRELAYLLSYLVPVSIFFIFSSIVTPYFFFFNIYSALFLYMIILFKNQRNTTTKNYITYLIIFFYLIFSIYTLIIYQPVIIQKHKYLYDNFEDLTTYINHHNISNIYLDVRFNYIYNIILPDKITYNLPKAEYCIGTNTNRNSKVTCKGCGDTEFDRHNLIPDDNYEINKIKSFGKYDLCILNKNKTNT